MAPVLSILVVEDNDELREVMVEAIAAEGWRVSGVPCAEAVDDAIERVPIDVLIADLNLPGEDGLALARRMREKNAQVGIIMATARTLSHEKRAGYESGADIYLSKPLSIDELCAAIGALARRLPAATAPPVAPAAGTLCLDTGRCQLQGASGRLVQLSPNETDLLNAFAAADQGRLESARLIEVLRLERAYEPKAALEIAIVRLRKKLQQAGAPEPSVKAIRNYGYQLCLPLSVVAT